MNSASATAVAVLGGERVVEGIHYGWLMRDHLNRYRFATEYCRGKRVLDVATGTGYGAHMLRSHGATEVVGVDLESDSLAYASDRYGADGLRWVNASAYALPFEREFDLVVSFETIEHLKQPEQLLRECKRVAKPGGRVLISTPESVGRPFCSPFHEFEYTRDQFRRVLARHFERFELFGQRRELRLLVKPLGSLPDSYGEGVVRGEGSHLLYTVMDRINKAPNHLLAWCAGMGEDFRAQIRPLDEPVRESALLESHYFAMIAVCEVD